MLEMLTYAYFCSAAFGWPQACVVIGCAFAIAWIVVTLIKA